VRSHKTPGFKPGVFVSAWYVSSPRFFLQFMFALLWPTAALHAADCAPTAPLQAARIDHVIDGDTVALQGGGHVRLIGINAPETGHRDRPGEPLAAAAKAALAKLLPRGATVYLQVGGQAQDHYGRRLAHIFQRDSVNRDPSHGGSGGSGNVEAELLRAGLAQHIAVPPNIELAACLQQAERTARSAGRGLWRDPYFAPRDALTLSVKDAGYRRVRVKIEAARRDRYGWWLESGGPLVLRLDDRDAAAFSGKPEQWVGKTLVVRGWISDRSANKAVRQRGFAPLLLPLRHPAMVETGI
jgi:endonuclease YncB( thermonuclease family)